MLTNKEAKELAKAITQKDIFPEAKQAFTRTLLDYYKELLNNRQPMKMPAVRRMW